MGEVTKIEWTSTRLPNGKMAPGATFNPWWGCTKVSAACDYCYAETLGKRFDTGWGKDAPRRFFGDKHWALPLKWDRAAKAAGLPRKVFCASMADVFEDNDSLLGERLRLWELIGSTPNLTWLLLTKRPHLMTRFAPPWWDDGWPNNVWAMTTVENQVWANARIPFLMQVPAVVRGLSMEPLLGPVTLPADFLALGEQAWVITGGESGPGARTGHPNWHRALRDQAVNAGVPYHFKQWGNWLPLASPDAAWLFPDAAMQESADGMRYVNVGKKVAGRQLDGRTWDEFPFGG